MNDSYNVGGDYKVTLLVSVVPSSSGRGILTMLFVVYFGNMRSRG